MPPLPRGICPTCCTEVALRKDDLVREHQAPKNLDRSFKDRYGKCRGSGKPAIRRTS